MMLAKNIRFRRACLFIVVFHVLAIAVLITHLVLAIIHATRSSQDISVFVKKLLPAGNCLCDSSTTFDCTLSREQQLQNTFSSPTDLVHNDWQFKYDRDSHNFGLSEAQCIAAFPGYFEEVLRATGASTKRQRKISMEDLDEIEFNKGTVRAMIADGKLRVLKSIHMHEDHRKKGLAILHSIHRSISISSNDPAIPNIEFVFSIEDMVERSTQPIWTLSRRPQDHALWLMPDFAFWSWDLQDLGTMDDVIEQVTRYESTPASASKIPKLVWRGKPEMLPNLRRGLLDVSKDKIWSDVQSLADGSSHLPENYISAADQCKYMFTAHAEGRSYSGSLKYRQICHSVVFIHKMQWIQHHHYLLVASGQHQNFVEVERDFSDLEVKIEHLIANPEEAKRIADNSVRTFREHYFAPAAEACYWRALIRGWANAAFDPSVYEVLEGGELGRPRGMRFENFALLESQKQLNYTWI